MLLCEEVAGLARLGSAPAKEVGRAFSVRMGESHVLYPNFVRVVWKSNALTAQTSGRRPAPDSLYAGFARSTYLHLKCLPNQDKSRVFGVICQL